MNAVKGTCRKCNGPYLIATNGRSREKIEEDLNHGTFDCFAGQHTELEAPGKYITIDWSTLGEHPEPASDEVYGQGLIQEYGRDSVLYLGNEAIGKALGVASLHTVKDLQHLGFGDFGNSEWLFIRNDAPRGTRFYIRSPRR